MAQQTDDERSCRRSTCENPRRGADAPAGESGKFCSTPCELKHEHIKADAREARTDEREEARQGDRYYPGP
jgi:hypothetical protein